MEETQGEFPKFEGKEKIDETPGNNKKEDNI